MAALNTGDTAWVLVSAALVLFMTPGLAAFYGGMVRRKNVLSTTMHSLFTIGSVGVIWALVGYSLAFSSGSGPLSAIIGGLDNVGLSNIGGLVGTIPQSVFAMFQGMFAIITVALISGAVAERMKFGAFIIFTSAWAILVYSPLAHWVWQANGWLFKLGTLDFAGGTVVEIASGAASLAAAIVLGRRKGLDTETMRPNNLPLTILGAGILWFGWYGFNAGSALAANELAGMAFLNTNVAGCAALLGWAIAETWHAGRPTVLGAATGAVAGLVVITPAAGFVAPWAAILMGFIGGACGYFSLSIKKKFKFDDALDVVGIHGVSGTIGMLLTGVFATSAINAAGSGFLDGNPRQILIQLVAIVAAWVFSFGMSFAILKVTGKLVGLRVDEETEVRGLDVALHSEEGYALE